VDNRQAHWTLDQLHAPFVHLQALANAHLTPSASWVETFLRWSSSRLQSFTSLELVQVRLSSCRSQMEMPSLHPNPGGMTFVQVLRSFARMEVKPGRDWLVLWIEASGPLIKSMKLKLISQVGGLIELPEFPYLFLLIFAVLISSVDPSVLLRLPGRWPPSMQPLPQAGRGLWSATHTSGSGACSRSRLCTCSGR
jgi:hypothetical protein